MSTGSDFEDTLAQLEQRVRQLEGGDVPLEQALELFEQGVELARKAHEHLDAAESRVAALSRGRSGIEETPIDE